MQKDAGKLYLKGAPRPPIEENETEDQQADPNCKLEDKAEDGEVLDCKKRPDEGEELEEEAVHSCDSCLQVFESLSDITEHKINQCQLTVLEWHLPPVSEEGPISEICQLFLQHLSNRSGEPSETAPQPSTGLGAYCACPKALRKAPWCYSRRLRVEPLPRSQENLKPNCVLFIISSKAEAFPHRLPFEIFLWPAFVDPARRELGPAWCLPAVLGGRGHTFEASFLQPHRQRQGERSHTARPGSALTEEVDVLEGVKDGSASLGVRQHSAGRPGTSTAAAESVLLLPPSRFPMKFSMNREIQYIPCKGWSTCKLVEDTHTYLYLSHDGIQKGLYCLALHFDYSEKAPETACPKIHF
ncbi:Zinc finger protein 423-like protein [Aix galericulata]|nr:Zinc finger protein 423-like protein [Aix galericulata]